MDACDLAWQGDENYESAFCQAGAPESIMSQNYESASCQAGAPESIMSQNYESASCQT